MASASRKGLIRLSRLDALSLTYVRKDSEAGDAMVKEQRTAAPASCCDISPKNHEEELGNAAVAQGLTRR